MTPRELIEIAKPLEDRRLQTRSRKAGFRIRVDDSALYIIPESTGVERRVSQKGIKAFLDEFGRSGVRRPGHYRDFTFDASYLLAILDASKETR